MPVLEGHMSAATHLVNYMYISTLWYILHILYIPLYKEHKPQCRLLISPVSHQCLRFLNPDKLEETLGFHPGNLLQAFNEESNSHVKLYVHSNQVKNCVYSNAAIYNDT